MGFATARRFGVTSPHLTRPMLYPHALVHRPDRAHRIHKLPRARPKALGPTSQAPPSTASSADPASHAPSPRGPRSSPTASGCDASRSSNPCCGSNRFSMRLGLQTWPRAPRFPGNPGATDGRSGPKVPRAAEHGLAFGSVRTTRPACGIVPVQGRGPSVEAGSARAQRIASGLEGASVPASSGVFRA